jgi:hypothetical protein
MRRRQCLAFLAVVCLAPASSHAQDRETRQAERKIARVVNELNVEMRGYERELKYFQRVPEFKPLYELRTQLVNQSEEMIKLDNLGRGSGPAVIKLAGEMDRTARKLDAETGGLERRARAVSRQEDRTVAERMKVHSDAMVKTIDRLGTLLR